MKHATHRSLLALLLLGLSVGCSPQESSQSSPPAQDSAEHNETTPTPDESEDGPQDELPSNGDNDVTAEPDPIDGEEVDSDESPTDVADNEEPDLPTATQPHRPIQLMMHPRCLSSQSAKKTIIISQMKWPSVFEARCVGCHQTGRWPKTQGWSSHQIQPPPSISRISTRLGSWRSTSKNMNLFSYASQVDARSSPTVAVRSLDIISRIRALQQWVQRAHDAVPCGDDDNPPTHSDPTDTSDPTEQTGM